MADNVLPLEEADSAELWLLPDLNGKRVISGGASDADAFEPTANHAANGYGASAAKNMAGFTWDPSVGRPLGSVKNVSPMLKRLNMKSLAWKPFL